jgi:hypothetical protein
MLIPILGILLVMIPVAGLTFCGFRSKWATHSD